MVAEKKRLIILEAQLLYKPSRPSVCWLLGWLVGWSVNLYSKWAGSYNTSYAAKGYVLAIDIKEIVIYS